MCVVSMVSDHYAEKWRQHPWFNPVTTMPNTLGPITIVGVPREEFDALKRDVEEMKALLKRAKDYDERTGQPDCEMADKVALLRRLADAVGVNLDEVFGPKS